MSNNINLIQGDCYKILKTLDSESIDMCITSPPYWNLRDYGVEGQLGNEESYLEYINNLIYIFDEVYRVLKKTGSCWVNIGDVYSSSNSNNVKKHSLLGIPDRFKIKMIDSGWLCRNEIIWHKPNAMPSSAKTRFNNDYEKLFFFTKDDLYYFKTQYEEVKSKQPNTLKSNLKTSKYTSLEQETSVRQGMNRVRGTKIIEVRPNLPSQTEFVDFIRSKTNVNLICESVTDIKRTTIEHWFRRDEKGFSYPTINDWNKVKYLIDDFSTEFQDMDNKLTYVEYETDDINKNIDKGRIKRAVWSINTKPFKGGHFAPFPEELIDTPIHACCQPNGTVIDIFMGSGTTGVVAKKHNLNFIGIELNEEYINIAKQRIENTLLKGGIK